MGIISSIIGSVASGIQQRRELSANKELNEINYRQNLDMWNKQASYNSPVVQAKMLKSAGLSDDAVAASLNGSSASLGSVSPASPAGSIAGSLGSIIGNSDNDMWQNLLARSEIQKNEADTQNSFKITEQTIKESNAKIGKIAHENNLTDAETNQITKLLPTLIGKNMAEIKSITEGIKQIQAQVDLLRKQKENTEQDTKNKELQGEQIAAQTENIKSETAENEANIGNINQDTENKKSDNAYQLWINGLTQTLGVDPRTPWLTQLVSLILSGKGAETYNTIIQFLDSLGNESKKDIKSRLNELGERFKTDVNPYSNPSNIWR